MDLFTALEPWEYRKRIVQDCDSLDRMALSLYKANLIGFDVETTGLDQNTLELVGIGFATDDFGSWYIPVGHIIDHPQLDVESVINRIKDFFYDDDKTFIAQNAKFDFKVIHKYGITNPTCKICDTMLMSWLVDERTKHNLEFLSDKYLNVQLESFSDVCPSKNSADSSISQLGRYCRMDAKSTLNLYHELMQYIEAEQLERALRLESELLPVVISMEIEGAFIDVDMLYDLEKIVNEKVDKYEQLVQTEAGIKFDVSSPKQLSAVLYDRMGIEPLVFTNKEEDEKGNKTPSTNEEALKTIIRNDPDNKIVGDILQYRHYNKVQTTYIDGMLDKIVDGKVYPSFDQLGARTGRFSCKKPNMQNIPRTSEKDELGIRNLFYAPDGYKLIVSDLSQIELRVLAHLCKDENLTDALKEGIDIHTRTAAFMFEIPLSDVTKEQRFQAKALNFGLVFGMTAYGLAKRIDKQDDVEYAENLMDKYFETYSSVQPWNYQQVNLARDRGYVRTLVGRKRRIDNLDSDDVKIREKAERKVGNTRVQGGAADILKGAMIKMHSNSELKELGTKLLLQVHDELVFLCPEENVNSSIPIIEKIMEHPFNKELRVPVKTNTYVTTRWGEAK